MYNSCSVSLHSRQQQTVDSVIPPETLSLHYNYLNNALFIILQGVMSIIKQNVACTIVK